MSAVSRVHFTRLAEAPIWHVNARLCCLPAAIADL